MKFKKFLNKKPLVILEMANNHMGDVDHGKKIINSYFNITKKFNTKIDFAIKFQFRDLKTYIHEDFLNNTDDKYVSRFLETQFSDSEWKKLINHAKSKFITICTPFDEKSVKKVIKFKFDFLKVASCSMDEWPLLEYIAKYAKNKKIISSLGGGDESSIRNIISFFSSKGINAKFLYCVAKYPTKPENLNLSYFAYLRNLYGDKVLGFSTHENPDEITSVNMAYAIGARIFEKHVAVETKNYKKNAYSVDTFQFEKWLESLNQSIDRYGSTFSRDKFIHEERKNLSVFKRGVFLRKGIYKIKGDKLNENDYLLAFPARGGQLLSNDLSKFKKFQFKNAKRVSGAIYKKDLQITSERSEVEKIREKINQLIKVSKVIVKKDSKLEISHHYGMKNFYKTGLVMITIHNSKYCKKLLFLLNKQVHPEQYHKKKQETFFILYGKIRLELRERNKKKVKTLTAGDILTIKPGVTHKFIAISQNGAVIEELSTTSSKTDSYYIDKKIHANKNRKTLISLN